MAGNPSTFTRERALLAGVGQYLPSKLPLNTRVRRHSCRHSRAPRLTSERAKAVSAAEAVEQALGLGPAPAGEVTAIEFPTLPALAPTSLR